MTGFLYTDKLLNQISLKKYKNGTREITRYEKRAEFVILLTILVIYYNVYSFW